MTQQTERDLKAELDSFDAYEPVTAWPNEQPAGEAVKDLGLESTIAGAVEEQRAATKKDAETSFFSNMFDRAVDAVRSYRGPLADRFEENSVAGIPFPGGVSGVDAIAGRTTGVSAEKAATGTVDEFTKGTNRGTYNTFGSFAGGLEQYGKTIGSETVSNYAAERAAAFKAQAEKPYFKPDVESLADIRKEKWFSDVVDYTIGGIGEGMASSAPFFAAGAVGGLPLAGAFGYTTSVGELREELVQSGISDEGTLAKYAYVAAVPHAILDQLTERGVLNNLSEEAKREATKGIVKFVLKGATAAGKGALKEGVTEAAQRVIELGTVAHANGGEAPNAAVVAAIFADVDKGVRSTILESGVKGALPGGAFGTIEFAGREMMAPGAAPVQEARVKTPNTATDATPVAPDTRPIAPMMDGESEKASGMGMRQDAPVFAEPDLEAARKAIQDAARGLPVEVTPEGPPDEDRPGEPTAGQETAPSSDIQGQENTALPEQTDTAPDAPISDEELDLPAINAEIEQYLSENEIDADMVDEQIREIAGAVYRGEDLGETVDRILGIADAEPAQPGTTEADRQRRLDARAAATDSAPLDASQIGGDFREKARAKFDAMPERDRDMSGETPEQSRARRLESRAAAAGGQTALRSDGDVRQAFAEVLASKTPRSQWAEAAGVDEQTLAKLIDEAVSDGRMEIRFGKPVRKATARVAPVKPERPAAPPSAPAMLRSEEKRLEAVKSDKAYAATASLFNARGTPESFQAALERVYSDKSIKNADLAQIAKAFTGKRAKPKNRQDAINKLSQAHTAWAARNKGKGTNANRADMGQSPGDVPEGRLPGDVRPNAEGRDAERAPDIGGAERTGDVGGRADLNDDGAGPANGVRGQGAEAGADPGDRAGTGEPRVDPRPTEQPVKPRERTDEEIAALEADLKAERDEQEAQRRDRLARNYRITDADRIGQGGPKQKVRANILAIETLKVIEEENRPATDEEKAILVKYVGWGAFSQAIFADYNQEFAKERSALKVLLTPDEYKSARGSTINAHYTSPDVIKGMWTALEHLGFKGGRVLEPSAGIGHFIGLQPEAMAGNSAWTAVELDTLSARITKALYGATDVRAGGFEDQKWPNDHFDLAISNVPFAAEGPYDPDYKQKFTLHDYFFVKSLDKVRPCGLVAFITSSGTLDKTRDQARREMEKRGTFLGAIRLPGGNKGAFKANAGTDVTTDILFFRKRMQGEPADINAEWTSLETVKTPEGDTGINGYFVKNPDMMLGKMRLIGSMYGKGEPVLIGPTDDMDQRIAQAAKTLPENAMTDRSTVIAPVDDVDTATDGIKESAYYEKDGKIYRKVTGVGVPQKLNKQDAARVKAFIPLRDTVNEMLAKQGRGDTLGMEDLRAALSATYDAFVKEFGPINLTKVTTQNRKDGKTSTIKRMPNFSVLEDDLDAYKVAAVEAYDVKTGKAVKTAIFTEDLLKPYERPTVTGPSDALAVSLNEAGRVDMKLIADVLGVSERRAAEELGDAVYLNPEGGRWQTATQYLSGDVVTKLADAKMAAELDGKYARNVAALEAVQPVPLTRNEITIPFGASYVPEDVLNAFLDETLETRGSQVTLNPATKSWSVRFTGGISEATRSQWATPDNKVGEIVEAALNSKPITVWRTVDKDTRVRDPKAEELARAKVTMLKEAFTGQIYPGAQAAVGGWVWNDEARATRLESVYNLAMNRLVKEQHDGSHLTFPGLARVISFPDGTTGKINLPPARTGAIWRIIQNGNTLIDHVVGAGKTWTSIMAVMEMKRLGQIRRPMFVVPNHMLMQFSSEFLQAYPAAKLLVATKESMSRAKRAEFAAKAAAEKWDGIIITHSAFSRLKMQDAAYKDYYEEILGQMESAKRGEDDATVKDIVKAQKRIKTKLDNLIKKESKDQSITFEELGVDHLTVDECFPYSTPVLTDRGLLPIGQIVEQKLPVKVLSQAKCGMLEWKPVVRWLPKKLEHSFVKVVHEHGHVICTGNHKIWTEDGYTRADALVRGQVLRSMRSGVSVPQFGREEQRQAALLLEPMRLEMADGAAWTHREVFANDERSHAVKVGGKLGVPGDDDSRVVGAYDCAESDEATARGREDAQVALRADVLSARWERAVDGAADNVGISPIRTYGAPDRNGPSVWPLSFVATMLQGGRGVAGTDAGNRSGWPVAQLEEMEILGREENGSAECSRVVSVEVLERGHTEFPAECLGENPVVYDIEVADNHNYFANGTLVSNCHLFKNLWFMTRHTRVKGISNSSESQRATDLYIKIRHLEKSRPGRSALFLTGTPLSNTMAEVYTMMRYLQKPTLDEYEISEFDSWAQTFGLIDTKTELASNSRDFTDITSFSKFVNIPELSALYGRIADTQTAESLGLERPNVKGGMPQVISSEPSDQERSLLDAIIAKMEALKGKKPEKGDPNFLSMFTKGLQASTDARLVDPSAPFNPDGKIGKAVGNIFKIWEEGNKTPNGYDKAQIVFLDMGVPGSRAKAKPTSLDMLVNDENTIETDPLEAVRKGLADTGEETVDETDDGEELQPEKNEEDAAVEKMLYGKFNLYEDIKNRLIEKGMPADQIAFIHDAKNDDQKAKMFEAVREGKIRVLIGSTGKMGVGTNVQKRLIALHHIDAPWRPSDLEQRDGRILRQGNKNTEIQIYRYITTKSFEAYRWQILERKASFIAQFRAGARGLRIAEDIDSPLPDASEIKAAATGDSRVIEYADLDRTVRGLIAQASAHSGVAVRARQALGNLKSDITRISKRIATLEGDAAKVADLKGEAFKITANLPGGKTAEITERKKAGQALGRYIATLAQGAFYGREIEIEFGTISGFEIAGTVKKGPDGIEVRPEIKGDDTYRGRNGFFFTEDTNPVSLIQHYERLVGGVPELLAEQKGRLADAEGQIPGLEAKTVATAFPKQAELEEKQKRLVELGEALKPKKQDAAQSALGTPEDLAKREEAARARMMQDDYASASDMDSDVDTSKVPGFWSENWKADRRYTLPDGRQIGFDDAITHLYNQAIAKAEANGGAAKERKAFLVIGFGGAGKSTLAVPLAKERKAVHASADDAKLIIPEFDGGKNSGGVHEESSELGKVVLRRLMDAGYNIVLEKLGSNTDSIGRPINQFKASGYSANLLYVRVPKAVAMERAIARFEAEGRAISLGTYDLNIDDVFANSSAKGDVGYGTFEWQEPDGWKWGDVSAPDLDGLVITDRFTGKPIAISGNGAARIGAVGGPSGRQVLDSDGAGSPQGAAERRLVPPQGADPETWLRETLASYGIDPAKFGSGTAKPLNNLVKEVVKGEAELIDRKGQLIRRVSPLALDIFADVDGKRMWLTEDRQEFADGRVRRRGLEQSIGEKLEPGEEPQASVARALEEELGITKFTQLSGMETSTKALESPSYPGIMSEYTTYKTSVLIDPSDYKPDYVEKQKDKTNYFVWQEPKGAAKPVTVSDFAKSIADLKARLAKEPAKSSLIQDDVVDIEEVSLSIAQFLPAIAEPAGKEGRLPKVKEAASTFVAGLQDVITAARQPESVDTTQSTYEDLDTFTDALNELDFIIEEKLQEGMTVEEEVNGYYDGLSEVVDDAEMLYDEVISDADSETGDGGFLSSIQDDIFERFTQEFWDARETGTEVSTDVVGGLPFFVDDNANLLDLIRQDAKATQEALAPLQDKANELWGVDHEEMSDEEVLAYSDEVDRVASAIVSLKWHAEEMLKFISERARPSLVSAFDEIRDGILKPTLDELGTLGNAVKDRYATEVERMNAMLDDDGDAEDGAPSLSVAGRKSQDFSEPVMPVDTGAESRILSLSHTRLREHARALFKAGLDKTDFDAAVSAIGSDRGLSADNWLSIAEAYTGAPVEGTSAADAMRAINRAFAERVHDVSLAGLGGFDPAVSGSNLDWKEAARERLWQMAERLPEETGLAVKNALQLAISKTKVAALEGLVVGPKDAFRFGIDAEGAKKIIAVSLAYGPDTAIQTFTHEEIHLLRRMNFFTGKEWETLSKLATRKPKKSEALRLIDAVQAAEKISPETAEALREKAGALTYREIYDIDARYVYAPLTEEQLVEEVVAHAAADWADGHDFGTRIERLMMKVRDFIEAVGNFLRGNGFETVDSIFNSVWSGEVASRARDTGWGRTSSPPVHGYKDRRDDGDSSGAMFSIAGQYGGGKGKLKAWHSTPAKFDKFDNRYTDEVGFHFGNKSQAHNRAYIMSNGNLWTYFRKWRDIPVEMDIQNPVRISADPGSFMPTQLAQQLVKDGIAPFDLIAQVQDVQLGPNGSPEAAKEVVRNFLLSKGYDAIAYPNTYEGVGDTSYMTFGTGNVRDARTGDVLYSVAGEAGDTAVLNKAIDSLKSALGIQVSQNLFGVTIKAGDKYVRINPRSNIRGQTSRATGGVGVRRSRDIRAIAHEGGHSLELMLKDGLNALKAKFAQSLAEPFAPDMPMPQLAPVGYSGLELDALEQTALADAVAANQSLLEWSAKVGNAKSAPRILPGKAIYDEAAYRKVELDAAAARANLIRLVGLRRADGLMDEVRVKTPANASQFIQERFSPMGAPKPRTASVQAGDALSEAFARWFEKYVMAREAAQEMAPDFFDAFEDLLEAEAPSVLEGLHTVQAEYRAWTKRASVEDLASDVVSVSRGNDWTSLAEGRRNLSDTVAGWAAEAYTGVIDELSPVQQIVRRLLAVADRNGVTDNEGRPVSLKVSENPYKIARMFRGSHATGYSWIKDGIPNQGETAVSFPGLQSAMETIFGNARWDEATHQAFGQYLISKRAVAEFDRLAAKKKRLADIETLLRQGANVWRKMSEEQGKDQDKLDRRTTRLTELQTIVKDRTNALRRAKTDERARQERLQELREGLVEAQAAIDDGSDQAKLTRDRLRRSMQTAERNARDARNVVSEIEQDVRELEMDQTFLGQEIVALRQKTEQRAPQIDAVQKSIELLRREQGATSKRGASRPPTLEPKEWHEEFLNKVASNEKYAAFEDASKAVHGFTQGLLTIRYQAGLISEELYRELSNRKDWYVPFMRDMTDAAPEAVFTGGGGQAWSPFKKFDGSDRAILNPLEVLAQEAYATAQHIALNESVSALAALAQQAGPGSAHIAEVLERTEDMENTPETWQRIRDIAISMGIDEADATLVAQRMEMNFANEDLKALWSPASKGPMAEPSLPLWENGQRKHVVLRDAEFGADALEAMMGLGKEQMHWLFEALGKPARLLQIGVTTHPTFMPRNLVRDIFDAWIKTGALPVVTQVRGAKLMFGDGEFLRKYTAAGGITGGRNIAALTSKEQQSDLLDMDPRALRPMSSALGAMAGGITGTIMGGPLGGIAGTIIGYGGARHGGLLKAVEAVETMTRLGVAAHAYNRALIHNPSLSESEAIMEAAFVARDVFDWNRRGSKTLGIVRMVTFLNAQIQGLDRAARALGGSGDRGSAVAKRLLTVYRREHAVPLSADEVRDLGEAYKVYGRLALYTALLLALYAMYRDDDRYEDIKDRTKATHSWLPGFLGVDVRLPKAFEWAVPSNFIEILWDKLEGRDPKIGERMVKSAQEVLVPPGIPQALNLGIGWTTNTDLRSIAPWLSGEEAGAVNRKIVGDELRKLAPEAQFDAFTSQLSKDIALAMAKAGVPEVAIPSPKMIDFTLRTGGYWGQDMAKAYQYAKEGAGFPAGPQPRVPDWPIVGGFTGIAARQSKSVEQLYRMMSQQGGELTTAASTYKALLDKSGNPAEAESFLARLEPESRAYAILAYHFPTSDKRRHPLERADAVAKVTRDIRKDIVLDRLAPQVKEGRKTKYDFDAKVALSPKEKTVIQDIMERLAQAESWNAFVVMGRPGWDGKSEMAVAPIIEELRAASPDTYKLFEERLTKAKAEDFETVKKGWPRMRDELLRSGADANF